jgi:hypothetical protein
MSGACGGVWGTSDGAGSKYYGFGALRQIENEFRELNCLVY